MKKYLLTILLCVFTCLALTGCGKKITLDLHSGKTTGTYDGELSESGLPNGYGKFKAKPHSGMDWTYEGQFVDGHLEGEGKITWEDGTVDIGTYQNDEIVPLKGEEVDSLYSDPTSLVGHYVELYGKVFAEPQFGGNTTTIQMYGDPDNLESNVIVYIPASNYNVPKESYMRIVGRVGSSYTGTNAFGATITAPTISATEYEIVNYKDAVMPTQKSIDVNQTQTQLGYSITVQKVELAAGETRVYLKVDNNGSGNFSVYSFDAKLSQNGKQYSEQGNYSAGYPELETELLPGNSSEGVFVFPAIEEGAFSITLESYTSNWQETLKPYTFNVNG